MGHISFVGKLDSETLKAGAPAVAPGFTLDLMAATPSISGSHRRIYRIPENRITLDRDGNIVLSYKPNNDEGHKRLAQKLKDALHRQSPCSMHGSKCHQGFSAATSFWVSGFLWLAWRIRTEPFASEMTLRPPRWIGIARLMNSITCTWWTAVSSRPVVLSIRR